MNWKKWTGVVDLMLAIGTMVTVPMTVQMLASIFIRRAPKISALMSAWATVIIAMCGLTLAATAAGAEPLPAICFWDPVLLPDLRVQVHVNDPTVAAAVASLRHDADKMLSAGPFSVVDKTLVPPSGDKHDFSSIGRYYWPDPSAKDGLPWVTIDGKSNPDIANGALGDEPRLTDLWEATRALTRAAYLFGDEKYAKKAASLLRTWFIDPTTRMNPNANYAARYPGHWDGRYLGIHSTARPIMDILDSVELLKSTPDWTSDDQTAMVAWCKQYLTWLTQSDFGKQEADQKNNHSTADDCLVVRLALFTGDVALAKSIVHSAETRRVATQIEPDGSQPQELKRATPWEYSRYNLEFFFRLSMLGNRVGVDLWNYKSADGRSIRGALDYVIAHAIADPSIVKHLGIDRIGAMMQVAAAVYHEPKYLQQMKQLGWSGDVQFIEAGINGNLAIQH